MPFSILREQTVAGVKTIFPVSIVLGFSTVYTLDLLIKFFQLAGLIGGAVYVFFQIKKIRMEIKAKREKETPSSSSNGGSIVDGL